MSNAHCDPVLSQPDQSLFYPEFGNFSELDEVPKNYFLNSVIDDLVTPGDNSLGDFSREDEAKSTLIPDFNAFSISVNPVKGDADKQTCSFVSFMEPTPLAEANEFAFMQTLGPIAMDMATSTSSMGNTMISQELISSSPMVSLSSVEPDISNCMTPDEFDIHQMTGSTLSDVFLPLLPLPHVQASNRTSSLVTSNDVRSSADSPGKKRNLSTVLQINSPDSSSSNTMEGNMLFNHSNMPRPEKSPSMQHLSAVNLGRLAELECSTISSRLPSQADVSKAPIPLHLMIGEASSRFPCIIQRSQSSHALGQSGFHGQSIDDVVLSPHELSIESSPRGFTRLGQFVTQCQESNGSPIASPVDSMRRVFSMGDLHTLNGMQFKYGGNHLEHTNTEEGGSMKIGHYTAVERRARLDRYRQKRTERNFSRKIKYACRKTLADSRPRIRGRFARTDDVVDADVQETGASQHGGWDQIHSLLIASEKCNMPGTVALQYWNVSGMKVAI